MAPQRASCVISLVTMTCKCQCLFTLSKSGASIVVTWSPSTNQQSGDTQWHEAGEYRGNYTAAIVSRREGVNIKQMAVFLYSSIIRFTAIIIRSGRDSMIVKITNFSVLLSSIILPANWSLLNFCSKPQIHWGFLHELFKLKEDDCLPLSNSFTM